MVEHTNCSLCGNSRTRKLRSRRLSNVVQCRRCGLVYRNPRHSEAEILMGIRSDGIIVEQERAVWHDSKIDLFKRGLKRIGKHSPKGKMLDVIQKYQDLPEEEKLIYRLGRRGGAYRSTDDLMSDPATHEKIERLVRDIQDKEGLPGVEKFLTDMVDRYV